MSLKTLQTKATDLLFSKIGFRDRLTLILLLALGTTLGLFSTILYKNFIRVHQVEFDTALYNYSVDIAKALDFNLFGEVVFSEDLFKPSDKIFPFAVDRTFLQLRDTQGRLVAKSRELGGVEISLNVEDRAALLTNRVMFTHDTFYFHNKETSYRVANIVIDRPGPYDFILQVASPMTLLQKERRGLIAFFLLSIPAVLILAGIGAFWISFKAAAPIDQMTKKAKEISAKNLNARLPVPCAQDEIRELALTVNELLDRLQSAFVSQEAFVSDASHQLKTPLAILRGELDWIRKETRSPQEYQEFFESASQEINSLSRLVEELLILARVESGSAKLQLQKTRTDEIAIDVVARMKKHSLVKSKNMKLELKLEGDDHSDYTVNGDVELLRNLLDNLIDNSIKYGKENGQTTVEIQDKGKNLVFKVQDNGHGFPQNEANKLFSRFYRRSNSEVLSQQKGFGLGLSIVKKIADLHGAQITAESTPDVGSSFSVTFPKQYSASKPEIIKS